MRKIYQIVFESAFIGLVACGNGQQTSGVNEPAGDSISVTVDSLVTAGEAQPMTEVANSEECELIARKIFALVLPQGENADGFEEQVIANCTPSFIEALQRENDFEDGSIAWWALRTMEQEGPSETSEILSITPEGNDVVVVSYLDMGHHASTRLRFVKTADGYKANSATVIYNGKERTVK